MEMINEVAKAIVDSVKYGGKVIICGNGGLAAESEHFAAELMGKYAFDVFVPCIALTTNSALITALSNDMGYEFVFSHQVERLGRARDVFIGMTTSKSQNIVNALWSASDRKLVTVILCGSKFPYKADYKIRNSGGDTAEIQERILIYLHKLAYEVKRILKLEGNIERLTCEPK
jgi:D-sedoheptulose 7-phosphate isomerase